MGGIGVSKDDKPISYSAENRVKRPDRSTSSVRYRAETKCRQCSKKWFWWQYKAARDKRPTFSLCAECAAVRWFYETKRRTLLH